MVLNWPTAVDAHFGFLRGRGFTDVVEENSNWWETVVWYRSATAGLKISANREFDRLEVHLVRLQDGLVPPYPIWVTDARLDWMMLDNVVEARIPGLVVDSPAGGLDDVAIERQLAFWADIVRNVIPDFLEGSFQAIEDGSDVVRRRVRQHPQQATVLMPEGTPVEDMDDVVSRLAEITPPEVQVKSRWYRRKG